jgi:serine/threonine-protein kinase
VAEALAAIPREGEILAGKYRVERVLGSGGMGCVLAAQQLDLDRRVALKFLLPEALSKPEIVSRFAREARAAARIHSEHVVRIIDVGTSESTGPYIVMEYLQGEDLAQVLAARGPLPFKQAVDYVLQASEALAEAHALGIIHRDLKPANLFLASRPGGEPVLKVLDFGISKGTVGEGDARLTTTTSFVGSPVYMSPEQLNAAHTVDARADIWSLGVVLYELLTHQLPFNAPRLMELVGNILSKTPLPIRLTRPEVPVGLEAAVLRCLEKDPTRRFANVAQLAAAVAPFGPPSSEQTVSHVSKVLSVAVVGSDLASSDATHALDETHVADRKPVDGQWTKSSGSSPPMVTSQVRKSGPSRRTIALGVATLMVVAVIAVRSAMVQRPGAAVPAVDPPAAAALSFAPIASTGAASAPSTGPVLSASSAVPVPVASSAAPAASAPRPAVPSSPVRPAAPAASTSAPAPSSSARCSYQSYVDPADGETHFKRVCP